jgi:hypothetical protein
MREPFSGWTPRRIADELDPWTVAQVLLRPRDKNRNLIVSPKGDRTAPLSFEEDFYLYWKKFGLPDWRIKTLLDAELARVGGINIKEG